MLRETDTFRFSSPLRGVNGCTGVLVVVLVLIFWLAGGAGRAIQLRADDFSHQDRFFARLVAPMTSIVDGKPFRDGLRDIAARAEVNLWLDRKVDPTAPVSAGTVGPTVFGAIEQLAAERACVAMPVKNVVLVGRPDWVDRTAATLLSLKSARSGIADVIWEDLTTPQQAAASAAAGEVVMEPKLPHDLWPSTTWKGIDRRVALTLVLAQFDRRPQSTTSLGNVRSVEATDDGTFSRRYSHGQASDAIRRAMKRADPKSRTRVSKDWLIATGSVHAHRAAVAEMLKAFSTKAGPDPEKDTFTLKRLSTNAENALRQLAQSARRTCVIEEEAREACSTIVTIEGEDVTLKSLVDMVADQAGLVALWGAETITISLKPGLEEPGPED